MRQHDPVVVSVRLVTEHGDLEHFRAAAAEDLLDGAGAGHAVADHHQLAAGVGVIGIEQFGQVGKWFVIKNCHGRSLPVSRSPTVSGGGNCTH